MTEAKGRGGPGDCPQRPTARSLPQRTAEGGILLPSVGMHGNLVSMTRLIDASKPPSKRPAPPPGHWLLQDAKARFSELVRRVRSEGPQHVTVHGRDEVVVIAAEEFRRLQGERTGQALVAALQASPHRDIDLSIPRSEAMPVRDVQL